MQIIQRTKYSSYIITHAYSFTNIVIEYLQNIITKVKSKKYNKKLKINKNMCNQ